MLAKQGGWWPPLAALKQRGMLARGKRVRNKVLGPPYIAKVAKAAIILSLYAWPCLATLSGA
jgi:hypothetical protein